MSYLRDIPDQKYCIFDFETESLNLLADNKPWSIGYLIYQNGKILKRVHKYIKWKNWVFGCGKLEKSFGYFKSGYKCKALLFSKPDYWWQGIYRRNSKGDNWVALSPEKTSKWKNCCWQPNAGALYFVLGDASGMAGPSQCSFEVLNCIKGRLRKQPAATAI